MTQPQKSEVEQNIDLWRINLNLKSQVTHKHTVLFDLAVLPHSKLSHAKPDRQYDRWSHTKNNLGKTPKIPVFLWKGKKYEVYYSEGWWRYKENGGISPINFVSLELCLLHIKYD